MKTIRVFLVVIAVAAVTQFCFGNLPTLPCLNCVRQVKDLSEKINSEERTRAFDLICQYYADSNFSKELLLEYTNLIAQAQNNLDVIVYSAELASGNADYAPVFLGVAKTASGIPGESEMFMEILSLTKERIKKVKSSVK